MGGRVDDRHHGRHVVGIRAIGRHQIRDEQQFAVRRDGRSGAKDRLLLGMLAVSVGPVLLPKFLDFLHAWSMRREGRTVKVKLQTAEGAALEV